MIIYDECGFMAGRHGANDPERYDGYYTSVPQHQEAKKSYRLHPASQASRGGAAAENLV